MPTFSELPDDFDFDSAWKKLNATQKKFVLNRHKHKSKKKTADAIGVPVGTVYNYPEEVTWCVHALMEDQLEVVKSEIRDMATDAVRQLPNLMEQDSDKSTKLASVRYVLDQVLGKATQSSEVKMNAKLEGININITGAGEEPDVE